MHLVGFIISIYHDARSAERQINLDKYSSNVQTHTTARSATHGPNLNHKLCSSEFCYFPQHILSFFTLFLQILIHQSSADLSS